MSLKIFTKRFNLLFCTMLDFFFFSNITEHKVPFQNLQKKRVLNRSGFKKRYNLVS